MRDERLFGGTTINPFCGKNPPARPPADLAPADGLPGGPRPCSWSCFSPAFAADGDLDPSFITGTGQFSGVQNYPRNQGADRLQYRRWIFFSISALLLFGTFYGVKVGDTYPPNNGANSCIARLADHGTLDAGSNVNG